MFCDTSVHIVRLNWANQSSKHELPIIHLPILTIMMTEIYKISNVKGPKYLHDLFTAKSNDGWINSSGKFIQLRFHKNCQADLFKTWQDGSLGQNSQTLLCGFCMHPRALQRSKIDPFGRTSVSSCIWMTEYLRNLGGGVGVFLSK